MKPFSAAFIILLGAAGLAQAEGNTQILAYGNEPGCARYRGEQELSDGVKLWHGDTFEFHETSCTIGNGQQIGSGAILMPMECSGEGETWEDSFILQTTADPDHYVFTSENMADDDLYLCK